MPPPAGLFDALALPLVELRDQYASALTGIQAIVAGLESIAVRPAPGTAVERPTGRTGLSRASTALAQGAGCRASFRSTCEGQGFGAILDFQERVMQLPGVARVSINAIDDERATLVVELEEGEAEGAAPPP